MTGSRGMRRPSLAPFLYRLALDNLQFLNNLLELFIDRTKRDYYQATRNQPRQGRPESSPACRVSVGAVLRARWLVNVHLPGYRRRTLSALRIRKVAERIAVLVPVVENA